MSCRSIVPSRHDLCASTCRSLADERVAFSVSRQHCCTSRAAVACPAGMPPSRRLVNRNVPLHLRNTVLAVRLALFSML